MSAPRMSEEWKSAIQIVAGTLTGMSDRGKVETAGRMLEDAVHGMTRLGTSEDKARKKIATELTTTSNVKHTLRTYGNSI